MQIRKFLENVYRWIYRGVWLLIVIPSIYAMEGFQYGVRTDTFQPIHATSHWLWHSNFHAQIPSLDKRPQFFLVSLGSGVRGILTPYFTCGAYVSMGQLQNRLGKTYLINPGIECWFPWVKLGIHG